MRVIAGKARRLQLKTPEGLDTRPTTDRIKETLFNMLQPKLLDCVFLDLFSGSGAIGIEALSRGAKKAFFVENAKEPLKCIRENLENTHLAEEAVILGKDVVTALSQLEKERIVFDIVFMDPPYRKNLEWKVLETLKDMSVINEDTLIIVEASLDTDETVLEQAGYTVDKVKEYKTNKHIFLYRNER